MQHLPSWPPVPPLQDEHYVSKLLQQNLLARQTSCPELQMFSSIVPRETNQHDQEVEYELENYDEEVEEEELEEEDEMNDSDQTRPTRKRKRASPKAVTPAKVITLFVNQSRNSFQYVVRNEVNGARRMRNYYGRFDIQSFKNFGPNLAIVACHKVIPSHIRVLTTLTMID